MANKISALQKFLSSSKDEIAESLAKLRGGGGKAVSVIDDAVENLPMNRVNTMPVGNAIEGRVMREALEEIPMSRPLPDISTTAVNLSDDIAGMLPPPNRALPAAAAALPSGNKLPNMALPFVGAGLAGAGLATAMTEDTSVPSDILDNANRMPVNPKLVQQAVKTATMVEKAKPKQTLATEVDKLQGKLDNKGIGQLPPDDFDKKLQEAREADRSNQLLFGLLRASQQGGSAMAGITADTSYADMALKDANKYVDQLNVDEKLKTARKEVTDEDIQRDPNSDISAQARDIARKVGLKIGDNVSAKQLKDAGLPIGNLLTQKMAIDARKEDNILKREANSIARDNKKLAQDDKLTISERNRIDKMVAGVQKSDDFKGYQAASSAKVALENAIEKGDKTTVGSAFMIYAKIAQGDNSVVRESDMKNLAGSYNYTSPAEMMQKLSVKAQGGNFTPLELKQMKQVADVIQQVKGIHVQSQLRPIQTSLKKYSIPEEEVIDPAILRQFGNPDYNEPSDGSMLTTINTGTVPNNVSSKPVTLRSKATGTTKILSSAAAAKYLNDPNFEVIP